MCVEATCTRALEALRRAGVVAPRDLVWLAPALKRASGLPDQRQIPWAAWTVSLCQRLGAGEADPGSSSAGALAIVVTSLVAQPREDGGAVGAQDAVARWSFAGRVLGHLARDPGRLAGGAPLTGRIAPWLLGLGELPAGEVQRNPPVPSGAGEAWAGPGAPNDARLPPDQAQIDGAPAPPGLSPRPAAGIRDAVALWTAPPLLLGEDLAPWSRFGEAVAEPIGILEALVHLWLDPAAGDLRDAALTPLVALWLREPPLRARLLAAYAGERRSPARRFAIHALLAGEAFRAALSRRTGELTASARAALSGARLSSAGADFLGALEESFRFFDELAAFRAILRWTPGSTQDPPLESERAPLDDAEADCSMAVASLRESAPWSGSWEVQRAGVLGSKEPRVGQWFVRGTILQALLEMGGDVRAEVAALLDEIPPGELRYYGGWREIPPDADDLALMLQLVAATGRGRDRAETWIGVMLANVDGSGLVPTWFHRDAAGGSTTTSGATWAGDDCSAVRLNLLSGLLSFDAARFDGMIQRNAARILERCGGGGVGGGAHYDAAYTALAFLRFARLHRERSVDQSLAGAVASAAAEIRARAAVSQRLDGGWGSPQRTAWCLEGAATAPVDPLLLERAMRYLGEHQLADGSWPPEPLYRIPMKRARAGHHQGRELTTTFCARALHASAAVFPRRSRAADGAPSGAVPGGQGALGGPGAERAGRSGG